MDCFPILQSYRIFSKRLELRENFLYLYDNDIYSIYINFLCFSCGQSKWLLQLISVFCIPLVQCHVILFLHFSYSCETWPA
jgi:hypothetical protein